MAAMERLNSITTSVVTSDMAGATAERLLVNGKFYQRAGAEHASWLRVVGSTIAELGSGSPPEPSHDKVQIVDLKGKFVLPGLHDSHIHTYSVGEASFFVNLGGCDSIGELKQRVKRHAEAHRESSWIIGVQWAQHEMGGTYPCAADLDDAMGDDTRPVFLWRACWHIGCANTAALAVAGLGANMAVPSTPGGVVDVDSDGVPTGILRERATDLITPYTEEKDQAVRRRYFEAGVAQCVAQGLTSLQSNDGGGAERGNRGGSWEHYVAMERAGTLPLRVYLTVDYSDLAAGIAPPSGAVGYPHTAGGLLKCDRVKLFGDGSLGAETAAIRGKYNTEDGEERPAPASPDDEEGVLIQPPDELAAKMTDAKRKGFRLEVHAIGDRAAATVLDGLEAAGVTPDDRAVITHCQLLGADLIERMAGMQCVANIQPQFVVTDAPFARVRVPARIQAHAYAWRSLLDAGIPCAGGSDAPVETPTPLIGMHDAIFRHGARADPATVYRPEERLTFAQALDLYTVGAAYACGEEKRLGRIAKGFECDLTVLDVDVAAEPRLLATAKVEQVWVAGIPRFDRARGERDGVLPPGVQLGGPYIYGKNGPKPKLPLPADLTNIGFRMPHRLACGGGMRAPGSGCDCGDAARCGRVPFADTFLLRSSASRAKLER